MTEKYTTEFKQNLLRTFLQEYKENAELSFSSYVRENFPEVVIARLVCPKNCSLNWALRAYMWVKEPI